MSVDETQTQSTTSDSFTRLNTFQFALLKTFRKSGVAVPTPIWFALEKGTLYFMTGNNAGKLKRIRNNGHVILIPCDARGTVLGDGTEVEGQARELSVSEHQHARSVLARKYGLQWRLFNTFMNLRRTQRTFIEITPA